MMNELKNYIFIQWYCSKIQRNRLLRYIVILLNLKNVMLREKSLGKIIYCLVPFIWNSRKGKTYLYLMENKGVTKGQAVTIKDDEEILGGDKNALCFYCSGFYVYICKNSSNSVLVMGIFYCMYTIKKCWCLKYMCNLKTLYDHTYINIYTSFLWKLALKNQWILKITYFKQH